MKVEIPGEPVAQGRPRFARVGKGVRAYDPPKSRNWKATAQEHMRLAAELPDGAVAFIGPVAVNITAMFTCPQGDFRKRRPLPRRWHSKRPDAENITKAVLDAATGILWLDDSQVAWLKVRKIIGRQGEAPGVWLEVRALDDPPVEVP